MKTIYAIFTALILFAPALSAMEDPSFRQEIILNDQRDPKWKDEIYDKLKGDTHEEKAHNALTTLEMKAVSEIELWELEDELLHASKELYDMLGSEEQLLFLKTHTAWKKYILLQADYLAGNEGSAAPLFYCAILKSEIKRRVTLYQEMIEGRSIYTTGFSMYE
jgi:hypothetical protein